MAMVMVPADFTDEGTVAAIAALVDWVGMTVVGRPTVDAVVDEPPVVVGLVELPLQAAASTVTEPMAIATVTFRNPCRVVNTLFPPRSLRWMLRQCDTKPPNGATH